MSLHSADASCDLFFYTAGDMISLKDHPSLSGEPLEEKMLANASKRLLENEKGEHQRNSERRKMSSYL